MHLLFGFKNLAVQSVLQHLEAIMRRAAMLLAAFHYDNLSIQDFSTVPESQLVAAELLCAIIGTP